MYLMVTRCLRQATMYATAATHAPLPPWFCEHAATVKCLDFCKALPRVTSPFTNQTEEEQSTDLASARIFCSVGQN